MKAFMVACVAFLLFACASPQCPSCPKEDMVLFVPQFGIVVKVEKGTFDSKDAMTVKAFEKKMKEERKKRGLACRK